MSEGYLSQQELSQRFMGLVVRLAQEALYLLRGGSGEGPVSLRLEEARAIIDGLEALQVRVAGNVTEEERSLLEGVLTQLRLVFVEAVTRGSEAKPAGKAQESAVAQEVPSGESGKEQAPAGEELGRKRFVKKYGPGE